MLDVVAIFVVGTAAAYFPLHWLLERLVGGKSPVHTPEHEALLDWVLDRNDWVVMDMETTGLGRRAEPVEIAILAADGSVLLDRLIRPKGNMKRSAKAIHGIERKSLRNSPTWPDVMPVVATILTGRQVIAYNVEFDQRMLAQASAKWEVEEISFAGRCAMLAYARHRAEPHPWRRGDVKWHKLVDACRHEGIADEQPHRALGDARLVHALVLKAARERRAGRGRSRTITAAAPVMGWQR